MFQIIRKFNPHSKQKKSRLKGRLLTALQTVDKALGKYEGVATPSSIIRRRRRVRRRGAVLDRFLYQFLAVK